MTEEELQSIIDTVTNLFQSEIERIIEDDRDKATELWIAQKTTINMIMYAATAQAILKSFGSLLNQSR